VFTLKKQAIEWGLRLSILSYVVLHALIYLFPYEIFTVVLSIFGFLVFVISACMLGVKNFKLPLMLFLSGACILLSIPNTSINDFLQGMILMSDVIGLIVMVPLIGWVLKEEPYFESALSYGSKLFNTSRKLYFGVICFTQITSNFLLYGSIPLVYQFSKVIVKENKGEAWDHFISSAILRGFALATLWLISGPSFIYAVESTKAPLVLTIAQGVLIAFLGVVLSLVFLYWEEKRYRIDLTTLLKKEMEEVLNVQTDIKTVRKRTLEFLFLFLTLFGCIFIFHSFVTLKLMLLIPLIILSWTFLYYLMKRKPARLFEETKEYVKQGLIAQSYQFSLMLGAGSIIYAINQTNYNESLINGIELVQETLPFINLLFILPFIIVFFSFVGLGPLTVIVLIVSILESIPLSFPPDLIVLSITCGNAVAVLLSPLIMPILVLGGVNGLSGYTNGVKYNLKYAIVFFVMVQVYIQGMLYFR
jgi:hypothetical protein